VAFVIITLKPKYYEINFAALVFPIPEGPVINHAFAFGFGIFCQLQFPPKLFFFTTFLLPRITTSYQSLNH